MFQVGFNDSRTGSSAEEIQEKLLDLQIKYNEHFPNARQHLTFIPPLDNSYNEANLLIQKLASFTESNAISTKEFCDAKTSKFRQILLEDDKHYSAEWGVKILSKAIMKSLYSQSNIGSDHLTTIRQMRQSNINTINA